MVNKLVLALSLFGLFSCINSSTNKMDKFDEKDFLLINSSLDSNGKITSQLYQHKNDSNRFFTKNFWENGNIQASLYYLKNEKYGPFRMFDSSGVIDFEGVYIKNLHTGLDIFYRRGKVVDFSFFLNGKEMPIDSVQKKLLLSDDKY